MKSATHEATIRGVVAAALAASQTSTSEERIDAVAANCGIVDVDVIVTDAETGEVLERTTRPQVRVVDESGEVRRANRGLPTSIGALIEAMDNATADAQRKAAARTAR
jgi:hypothetical protein